MEFEDLLKEVGDFGKFQKLLIVLFLIPSSIINVLYDFTYMFTTPDHWCYVPELANLSKEVQQNLITPLTLELGLVAHDKCRMYDIDYGLVNITTIVSLINGSDIKTKECNRGWVYDKSVYTENAVTKFDLVCNRSHSASLMMSLGSIGLVIGTPIFSAVTDWIGRKKSFLFANIIFILTLISPIVFRDIISFSICRLISGSIGIIFYQVPYIIAMEFVGPDHRSMASSLSAMAYALGGCILPIVVYITGHWVLLAVFQFAITIPIIIFWRYIPESASWLITQKRYSEAHEILNRVATINGRTAPENMMTQIEKVGEECERKTNSCGRKDSVYDLVRIPELLKQTLILTLLIVANVVAYYGLYLNALNFHGNELTNSFLLSLVDLPALCLGWYLIEGRLGRRWTNTISLMFCGISLCVPAFVDPSQTTIITIMSLLGKMGTAVSYMVIYQQSAEVFPTTLRSEGMGICSTAGSAVSIIVPQIAYLGRYGLWIPLFIMGFGCLIAGIASSFLPETLNENLPQNSADSQKFGKNKSYFCLANVVNKTHL